MDYLGRKLFLAYPQLILFSPEMPIFSRILKMLAARKLTWPCEAGAAVCRITDCAWLVETTVFCTALTVVLAPFWNSIASFYDKPVFKNTI